VHLELVNLSIHRNLVHWPAALNECNAPAKVNFSATCHFVLSAHWRRGLDFIIQLPKWFMAMPPL
jgi:hypothetical protein